jgi:hypothetical protein
MYSGGLRVNSDIPLNFLGKNSFEFGYIPELNKFTNDPRATILLQAIIELWEVNGKQDFIKFKEPCGHPVYKEGESWLEMLAFSRNDFNVALKKIGFRTRTKDKDNYSSAPVIYWTDRYRLTHYKVNESVLGDWFDRINNEGDKS